MTTPGNNTKWVVALLLSVGLNGLLGGYLMSERVKPRLQNHQAAENGTGNERLPHRLKKTRGDFRGGLRLSTVMRYMSEEDRKALHAQIRARVEATNGTRPREVFSNDRNILETAGAEAFDGVALKQAVSITREKMTAHNAILDDEVIKYLAAMPDEERTALFATMIEDRDQFLERLERRRERREKR
ncbi:MAG: periplasmic heavy metal sensor [Parvularculaceae bacterium]